MPEFALVTYDEEKFKCFHCGSTQVYSWGEYNGIPYFNCKKCKRKFTTKDTWLRMKTDKMHSYHNAFNSVFYTRYADDRVTHLTSEGFGSQTNINLIERLHSSIKQRTKVMWDLKKSATASILLDGFINHYNFFLEHGSLNSRTPAQEAGIGRGIGNWGDLINLTYKSPVVKRKVSLDGY